MTKLFGTKRIKILFVLCFSTIRSACILPSNNTIKQHYNYKIIKKYYYYLPGDSLNLTSNSRSIHFMKQRERNSNIS